MLQQHPITPSIELVKQWSDRWHSAKDNDFDVVLFVAIEAARWGADQELEACCELLVADHWETLSRGLRFARRPKPPSLKELALEAWAAVEAGTDDQTSMAVIRRALEALTE